MFLSAAIVLVADQYTKHLAMDNLGPDLARGYPYGRAIAVIPGFFDFRWAENTGGAFSIMHTQPWIILAVSSAMILGLIIWALTMHQRAFIVQLALGLIIGGAIGNLIDRVRFRYVIDFLHFYFIRNGREYFWPTFNVADMGIIAGIGLFVYLTFFTRLLDPPEAAAAPPAEHFSIDEVGPKP
jgi:signal peptidase II